MPVNFFHLTSAAVDADAALNEAPSPVNDQRPSTAPYKTLGQALAARPSTAPASTERPKTAGDRPQTARDKRRFADSIPRIPLAPTYQGERPPRRVPWALGAVFTTVTDEDLKRYKQKQRSRRRGKSLHTMYALAVRTALLMRKVQDARQRRKDAFQRDLAQRRIAASWRRDNPVKRRRKRAEKIIHGPVLASLGKNARRVLRHRSVERITWFLGEAQHLPPFKLVMVKFLHAVRNCQRIWRHKLRPHFAMIEVLGRAMDRAQERHRTDLIYFGNLVRAGKVDLAMVQAEEEQARIPVTYGRRSRRSMSSVNSGVTEEPSLIHEQPKPTLADKRRMLLEVPQDLEREIDEVEAHMQAIMNDTLKMDRRSKTRALRRINGKLSQLLQERDDYLSGKKLRQFEASLVCKKAPKMSRKPGDDWTPDARRYCKERRNKLVRIERKADDLMGDAEKEELRRAAEAEAALQNKKLEEEDAASRKEILRKFLVRRRLAHERDHFAKEQAAMLAFDEKDALSMVEEGTSPRSMLKAPNGWSLKVLFATTDFRLPVPPLKVFSPTLDAEMLALLRRSLLEKHIVSKAARRYARAQCVGYLKKWLHLAMLENPSLATWSSERKGVADLKALQFRVRKEKDARLRKLTAAMFVGGLTRGNSIDDVVERAKTPQ